MILGAYGVWYDILDDDLTVIFESFQIRFEGEVIVEGLHIGGQDLTTTRNIHGAGVVAELMLAHVSVVGAVSDLRGKTSRSVFGLAGLQKGGVIV